MRRAAAAALIGAMLLAACTSAHRVTRPGPARTSSVAPSSTPGTSATSGSPTPTGTGTSSCPTTYAAPDPQRPLVTLRFVVSTDLRHVDGTEHVVFTPDLPITQLVFRLTANTRPTAAAGNAIRVVSAHADHGALSMRFSAANASPSTQGGLLIIPFRSRVAAGTAVTADLGFQLTLGSKSFDRFGRAVVGNAAYAWFGSGQPLLAWQSGYGWHTEAMIDFIAESATSEAADTDLTVVAPRTDSVISSGDAVAAAGSGTATTVTWHAHIATARDVSVAVGPFAVTDTTVNGTRLRVAAYSVAQRDALVPKFVRAITALTKLYGPFPFPSLSVARVPGDVGGIEYPSSILMLADTQLVAVHETAHQWFYAMVGDSQAQHPFLDEAFAEYSEQLIDNDESPSSALIEPGSVGRSTESYGEDEIDYYYTTYTKGSAALEAARAAGPPPKWDAAMRCYINKNAWRIVVPSDLAAAIASLPKSVHVLRSAGMLP